MDNIINIAIHIPISWSKCCLFVCLSVSFHWLLSLHKFLERVRTHLVVYADEICR